MQRLIVDIESAVKARELQSVLEELGFVNQVTLLHDVPPAPAAGYESEAALKVVLDRRNQELESGAVRGLSLDELEAGAKAIH